MSLAQVRGGIPRVFRTTAPTAGRKHNLKFYTSHVTIRNQGANVVRMYFTEADFDAGENYVVVPVAAATHPYGEWSGPVEAETIWLRAITAGSAVELVTFQRRG